jgi:tetratricopeptide (TPR) repeat protein
VILEADRIRVSAQLIYARSDSHLWTETYDRELHSVLDLQRDVARAIAEQVRLELTPEEQSLLTASRTVRPEAYDAYLRGLELRGPSLVVAGWGPQAIEQFQRAVELDPSFAEAWVELAGARVLLAAVGLDLGYRGELPKAREAAQRALDLDDRLAGAHSLLGSVRLYYDWDFAGARRALERGVELSPSDPIALRRYAQYLLYVEGQAEQALEVWERLVRVAPVDIHSRAERMGHLFFARRYERASEEVERLRRMDPSYVHTDMASPYIVLGRFEEAHRALVAWLRRCGAPCDAAREARERGWGEGGWEGAMRASLDPLTRRQGYSPWVIALGYAAIGEIDEALAWLERSHREREPLLVQAKVHPHLDSLRSDPRFDDLLRRIGFRETPEDPGTLAEVSLWLIREGRPAEAIANLERALRLAGADDERQARWPLYLSLAHFAAGRVEQAADQAERALEMAGSQPLTASSPFRPHHHLALASYYANLGRLDEARQALHEPLRQWPTVRIDRDLKPFGRGPAWDRYLDGLRMAGLKG